MSSSSTSAAVGELRARVRSLVGRGPGSVALQRRQCFEGLSRSAGEVARSGRAATAGDDQESFYRPPCEMAPLAEFPAGVGEALRRHLADQGLTALSEQVGPLEAMGRQLSRRPDDDGSVSELVYEMH